jgi:hypothetical protein
VETLILITGEGVDPAPRGRFAQERGRDDAVALGTAFVVDAGDLCARWRTERIGADPNRRVVLLGPGHDDPIVSDLAFRANAHVENPPGTSLRERVTTVMEAEFGRGARAVAVLAARAPTLPLHLVDHAFRALHWERSVIGPTFHGGLWLLGAQRGTPLSLPDTSWSTALAAAQVASRLALHDVHPHLLPFWYDVDSAADVETLVWHLRAARAHDARAGTATWEALARRGFVSAQPARQGPAVPSDPSERSST